MSEKSQPVQLAEAEFDPDMRIWKFSDEDLGFEELPEKVYAEYMKTWAKKYKQSGQDVDAKLAKVCYLYPTGNLKNKLLRALINKKLSSFNLKEIHNLEKEIVKIKKDYSVFTKEELKLFAKVYLCYYKKNIQLIDLSFIFEMDSSFLNRFKEIIGKSIHKKEKKASRFPPRRTLKRLNTDNIVISDLSPLADLEKLEYLDLSNQDIADISPLKNLKNLRSLFLMQIRLWGTREKVIDLSPLKNMKNLENLDLSGNYEGVSDISPLKHLKKLKKLDISRTYASDVSPLKKLDDLEEVRCIGMPTSNAKKLKSMGSFKVVDWKE